MERMMVIIYRSIFKDTIRNISMDDTIVEECLLKIYNVVPDNIDLDSIADTLQENMYYVQLKNNNPELSKQELKKRLFVYSLFMILWIGSNFDINDLKTKLYI